MDDESKTEDTKDSENPKKLKRPDTNALKRLTNMMIDTY
jgi:hypothetical protein